MKKAFLIIGGLFVLLIIGSIAVQKTPVSSTALDTTPSISSSGTLTPAPHKTKEATTSQKNAVRMAKTYLETMPFSKKGLIRQLSSDAGSGFSTKDATYAVNHIKVNWNTQAVKSGKNYLDTMAFSRTGLIRQLSSSAGSQFTNAQAVYAANKLGL